MSSRLFLLSNNTTFTRGTVRRRSIHRHNRPSSIKIYPWDKLSSMIAERSSTIPHVLAEQWSRLRGRSFWESWRSSLMSVQQPQQQPNFSACLSHAELSFYSFYYRCAWIAAMVRADETAFDQLQCPHPTRSNSTCVPQRNFGTPAVRSGARLPYTAMDGRTKRRYH
jgi:hypothetical protein